MGGPLKGDLSQSADRPRIGHDIDFMTSRRRSFALVSVHLCSFAFTYGHLCAFASRCAVHLNALELEELNLQMNDTSERE
jgi:hypothetical protein